MTNDESILDLARKLGEAIRADGRSAALQEAAEALEKDEPGRKLQEEYAAAAQVLQDKAGRGEPLEPEDKRRELELRRKVASHATIRGFLRAQADFAELMNAVNRTLEEAIGTRHE